MSITFGKNKIANFSTSFEIRRLENTFQSLPGTRKVIYGELQINCLTRLKIGII